jgi:hypothetical protein
MNDDILTIEELANRRQYFRVDDQVLLELAALNPDCPDTTPFELGPAFGLISEFQLLDVESKHLLRHITDRDKSLGQFLKVLNQKLDALSRVLALNNQITTQSSLQPVNLSEGGLSLSSLQLWQRQQEVVLKLILLPSYSGLILKGRVLSCQGDAPPYRLHIEFTDISDAHQQLIARHIMRRQKELAPTPAAGPQ